MRDLQSKIEDVRVRGIQEMVFASRNRLVPNKVYIFIWRALQERIPVRVALSDRGIDMPSILCERCHNDVETVFHSFGQCVYAQEVWLKVCNWWKVDCKVGEDLKSVLLWEAPGSFGEMEKLVWQAVIWGSVYFIWKARNDLIFNNRDLEVEVLFSLIQIKVFEWINARMPKGSLQWSLWLSNPFQASISSIKDVTGP